jgi:uncharacterized protein
MDQTLTRVDVTGEAGDLLRRLTGIHGPVMFHQSGGCCDGSAPMCYPAGEFLTGPSDVHLGDLTVGRVDDPVPFWMSAAQYEYWRHTHLTVDVVPGRGSGFPLEAPEGVRFLVRSRLMSARRITMRGGERRATSWKPARSYSDREPKNMKSSWLRCGLPTW